MTGGSPLWPVRLHHIRIDSAKPDNMIAFYRRGVGLADEPVGKDVTLLRGGERRLLIGKGETGTMPLIAFGFDNEPQLEAYRSYLQGKGFNLQPAPTPLFGEEAFALDDPDGRAVAFGVPIEPEEDGYDLLPGRLQHAVCATTRLEKMAKFYLDGLGLLASDWIREGDGDPTGEATAFFARTDQEHHSFAAFRAPEARLDHHSYEVTCWDDIRDWSDHFGEMEVPIWWGPGRHGPGNNLFIMIEDPDGNKVEMSAELELMHRHMPYRTWPHEERSLNLWGNNAWMRS